MPLPWNGTVAPFGFSSPHATHDPWLPQPDDFAGFTVEAEAADPRSMLALYRAALRIRHRFDGDLEWLDLGPDMLAFRRADLLCVTNFADQALRLPAGELLLASDELTVTGELPPDSTAWLLEAITTRKA